MACMANQHLGVFPFGATFEVVVFSAVAVFSIFPAAQYAVEANDALREVDKEVLRASLQTRDEEVIALSQIIVQDLAFLRDTPGRVLYLNATPGIVGTLKGALLFYAKMVTK